MLTSPDSGGFLTNNRINAGVLFQREIIDRTKRENYTVSGQGSSALEACLAERAAPRDAARMEQLASKRERKNVNQRNRRRSIDASTTMCPTQRLRSSPRMQGLRRLLHVVLQ